MTERTSHLAGLWFGAAISKMSHPNKAGSTTVKRARLIGKGSNRRQCCHNKNKKFPYRPTRDISLLSGHTSYHLVPCEELLQKRPIHFRLGPDDHFVTNEMSL